MNKLKISFLLSVYKNDNPVFLSQCLDSICMQTILPDEIIVVQEGEVSDEITSVINNFADIFENLFTLFKLPYQNGPMGYGLPNCLNYGIKNAIGDYIFRIDSDDICELNRVEIQKKYIIQNPSIDLFSSDVIEFDEKMLVAGKTRSLPISQNKIIKYAKFRNPFNGPSVVFRKDKAIKLGGYPNIPSNEDYCFWILFILDESNLGNINKPLVKMRGGDGIIFRRSSKRYRLGEIESIKFIYNTGFFSFSLFSFHLIFRNLFRLLNRKLILIFYKIFLRK